MAKGLDVHAYYQRNLNWYQVKESGVSFVWVKTTDGAWSYSKTVNGVTYYPKTMVDRAKDRGIFVGGYCYGQPGDGGWHADVLIEENKHLGAVDLVPAMDIESDPKIHTWGTQEAIDYGRAFCSRVIRRGLRPGIYMNNSMASATRPDQWPEDPVLWLARYGGLKPSVYYDVHQYTKDASIGGVLVDANESYTNAYLSKPVVPVKKRHRSEDEPVILLPKSSTTTGKPDMPPTPVIPAPGAGEVRIVIVPADSPVYLVDPTQIIHTSPDSEELPLDIPDRVFPGQILYATLNVDTLAVKLPYSSLSDFRVAIYRMD